MSQVKTIQFGSMISIGRLVEYVNHVVAACEKAVCYMRAVYRRMRTASANIAHPSLDRLSHSGNALRLRAIGIEIGELRSVRVKTEDRRQAIIEVALEVFRELGYERASMAIISRRLGGSKGTLYGYFASKEELFETAIKVGSQGPGDQIMDLLNPKAPDLRAVLTRFAKAYLKFILSEEVLSLTRTAIAEGSSSTLGRHLFQDGPGRALSKMAGFFTHMIEQGRIRDVSPEVVAIHFKGLIEAGFLEEALFGAKTLNSKAVPEAIDAFLRVYAK